jgi:predicted phosphohydrolase
MRIWVIADLHLSFGVPNKEMDVFGPQWKDHAKKMADHWRAMIHPDDLVLIPGDISWAMRLDEVKPDLAWIDSLPGTKVMIKGNHDYWWGSLKQMVQILPPSIHVIQNNAFLWKDIAIGGARLWDSPEYSFGQYIAFQKREGAPKQDPEEALQEEMSEKIFNRELERLKMSIAQMDKKASKRIVMTHYPPISADLQPSRASQIFEQNNIDIVVFGHLHNVKEGLSLFGERNGVRYILAAADYIRFQPILIS